jgi:hypothetical protein
MPTTTAEPTGRRPQALRRSWLLVLVVLGILGMHGLTGGTGTAGAHHSWTSGHSGVASQGSAHDMHGEEPDSGTTLALCLVLLMSLGVGLLVARRAAWPVRPYGLPARLSLPAAPLLRMSTPVPRFTVMRC